MAEPWTDDFAALGERTRARLRSLDATRASLSARTKETKMRYFKSHPVLAALIAIAALGVFAPLAYAAVERVLVYIDSDRSASEIEDDVRDQLEAAGVNADVHAEKSGDGKHKQLKVSVWSRDPNAPDIALSVDGSDPGPLQNKRFEVRIQARCELTDAQSAALHATVSSHDNLVFRDDGTLDPSSIAKLSAALAKLGYRDADVRIEGDALLVTINSPPSP